MKLLTALLATCFVAFSYGKAEAKAFDLQSRIGVVDAQPGKQLCLTIPNAKIAEGSRVRIVSPREPQSVATAVVEKKLSESCSRDPDTDPDDSFYSLRVVGGKLDPNDVSIAVIGAKGDFTIKEGSASIDLNGDKRKEFFRVCTSQEGLHLTVWSDTPLKGTRKWHRYYYLGYDVEPSCTDEEQ